MAWLSWNKPMISYVCENLFPFQAIFGVCGNTLTLLVLLSKPMRSRTNILLAMAAICDILFLVLMIPNNLSRRKGFVYEDCEGNQEATANNTLCLTTFYYFYVKTKTTFTFLMNLFSGSSTWFMVAVSFDRLWAIKSPFAARTSNSRFVAPLIALIFFLNVMTTMYMNFSFKFDITNQNEKSMTARSSEALFVFAFINVVFQIFIPMILLIVFNSLLIHCLRSRRQFLASATSQERHCSDEMPPLLENQRKITTVSRNGSNNNDSGGWGRQLTKAERHVTLTVALIVSAYLITHLPSAILYASMYMFNSDTIGSDDWYTLISLSTAIVISGKLANFFLFCMSSRHFRIQMKDKICCCSWLCYQYLAYKDSQAPRTKSIPLNQIGDSNSNVPVNS